MVKSVGKCNAMNPFVHSSSFSDLYDISLLPEENTSSTAPSIRFVKVFFWDHHAKLFIFSMSGFFSLTEKSSPLNLS